MQGIILAGGFGTRLRSVLGDVPKPMAPVAGRPFLAWLLMYLSGQGFQRIVMSIHHRGEQIRDYFGDTYAGIALEYAEESTPLGTGGAILLAMQKVDPNQPVFVLNGDTFFALDYRQMQRSSAAMAMALCPVADTSRYGGVDVREGVVIAFEEKGRPGPGLINAGVYRFPPDFFSGVDLPEAFSFETDFLYPRVGSIKPCACVSDDYFIDIGVPEDYGRAQVELSRIII